MTAAAATAFGRIAQKLIEQGYERKRVAHFLNKLVFCLFAQDIELLPERVFADILDESVKQPDLFASMLADLFRAMRERNGRFGTLRIPWFDGGLFDDDDVLPLHLFEIKKVAEAARLDWSAIEPSIFGTLFERGLDHEKRKQMASLFDPMAPPPPSPPVPAAARASDKGVGIHYTDPATIMKIIEPVVLRPLRHEWEEVKAKIEAEQAEAEAATTDDHSHPPPQRRARGIFAISRSPRPLPRARPRLRFRQLPLPLALTPQGLRSAGHERGQGSRHAAG